VHEEPTLYGKEESEVMTPLGFQSITRGVKSRGSSTLTNDEGLSKEKKSHPSTDEEA